MADVVLPVLAGGGGEGRQLIKKLATLPSRAAVQRFRRERYSY